MIALNVPLIRSATNFGNSIAFSVARVTCAASRAARGLNSSAASAAAPARARPARARAALCAGTEAAGGHRRDRRADEHRHLVELLGERELLLQERRGVRGDLDEVERELPARAAAGARADGALDSRERSAPARATSARTAGVIVSPSGAGVGRIRPGQRSRSVAGHAASPLASSRVGAGRAPVPRGLAGAGGLPVAAVLVVSGGGAAVGCGRRLRVRLRRLVGLRGGSVLRCIGLRPAPGASRSSSRRRASRRRRRRRVGVVAGTDGARTAPSGPRLQARAVAPLDRLVGVFAAGTGVLRPDPSIRAGRRSVRSGSRRSGSGSRPRR